ncbi:hypothetical protein BH09ACT12_BH09ACT12_25950 [soil metagenome]
MHTKYRFLALLMSMFLGLTLAITGGSAEAEQKPTYSVSISSSTSSLTLGEAVTVTGKVMPKAAKQTVSLQTLRRGKWKPVATATLTKKSKYKLDFRPDRTGRTSYRVCKGATRKASTGCSEIQRAVAYQWKNLYDMDYVDRDDIYGEDPATINGRTFKKSLVSDDYPGTSFIEYNLSRKCTQFRTTGGIEDNSETGANGNLEIFGDGNSVYSQDFSLGESSPISLSMDDVLRIRIETTTDNDGIDESVALGTPQAFCS